MAKKKVNTSGSEKSDIVKVCAFWGLAISAILYVVSGFISFLVEFVTGLHDTEAANLLGRISGIASIAASIALAVAIAIPAYGFVKGKKRGWKIFYWIVLAIFVLGVVFGLLPSFV